MNKIPPVEFIFPSTEDDDDDSDVMGEALINLAWRDGLDWARRGDERTLVELLRGSTPLLDNTYVRNFLADVLERKFKKPKGRRVRKPERTWGVDASGYISMVDVLDKERFEIRDFVRRNKDALGDNVYEEAAKQFGVKPTVVNEFGRKVKKDAADRVRDLTRRSSKAFTRGSRRSKRPRST